MAGNWFAIGKLQGFAREDDGAFVSFAAAAVAWGHQQLRYLFVPDFHLDGDRVVFAPGAVDKAIQQYGLPNDQAKLNAICEAALTADPALVAAKQAEMDARDRAELEPMFPCPDCNRAGVSKA